MSYLDPYGGHSGKFIAAVIVGGILGGLIVVAAFGFLIYFINN